MRGPTTVTKLNQTPNACDVKPGSETAGDKLRRQKGNSPDQPLRSLNPAQCERMWGHVDNQDVGLEAATIERVRNSSLVKWICAENSAGLKLGTEATDSMTGSPVVVW